MKKVWIFNQYGMLPEHGPMARTYRFIRNLNLKGCDATAFVASHPHNTPLQLITDNKRYRISDECPFPWVFVKTCNYEDGKGLKKLRRLWSIVQYFVGLFSVTKNFDAPDCIIGSSAPPFTALAALLIARRYKCKGIVEVRDLWPESLVVYGIASRKNPVVRLMYRLEKWLYTNADAIIFTMEGGRDYITDQGWDTGHGGPIDLNKVYHINNGVDLEEFDYNREHFTVNDPDLDDPESFKIIYTGSMRRINNVGFLLDVMKQITDPRIKLLIWGRGNETDALKLRTKNENITNVFFKENVEKNRIPYILSKADLCMLHWRSTPISRYGMSMNKLFEYLAAGKPVLSTTSTAYDAVEKYKCGISKTFASPKECADAILQMKELDWAQYRAYCENARKAAEDFDFDVLTEKLLKAINRP